MARKKKQKDEFIYSKNESFENLEVVQQMALNRKGKDDEINPDISTLSPTLICISFPSILTIPIILMLEIALSFSE